MRQGHVSELFDARVFDGGEDYYWREMKIGGCPFDCGRKQGQQWGPGNMADPSDLSQGHPFFFFFCFFFFNMGLVCT